MYYLQEKKKSETSLSKYGQEYVKYGQDTHANVTFANLFKICKTKLLSNDPQNNSVSRT